MLGTLRMILAGPYAATVDAIVNSAHRVGRVPLNFLVAGSSSNGHCWNHGAIICCGPTCFGKQTPPMPDSCRAGIR